MGLFQQSEFNILVPSLCDSNTINFRYNGSQLAVNLALVSQEIPPRIGCMYGFSSQQHIPKRNSAPKTSELYPLRIDFLCQLTRPVAALVWDLWHRHKLVPTVEQTQPNERGNTTLLKWQN